MSIFTTKLHTARKTNREQIKKQEAFNARLRAHAPDLKQYFEMFPPSVRKNVSVSAEAFDETVRFGVSMHQLNSLKDKRLMRVLEKFADWGSTSQDYTYGNQPNRDFFFTHQTPFGIRIKVAVYAYVKTDSPLCRVVVKGVTTKVVEEEVREIVCA